MTSNNRSEETQTRIYNGIAVKFGDGAKVLQVTLPVEHDPRPSNRAKNPPSGGLLQRLKDTFCSNTSQKSNPGLELLRGYLAEYAFHLQTANKVTFSMDCREIQCLWTVEEGVSDKYLTRLNKEVKQQLEKVGPLESWKDAVNFPPKTGAWIARAIFCNEEDVAVARQQKMKVWPGFGRPVRLEISPVPWYNFVIPKKLYEFVALIIKTQRSLLARKGIKSRLTPLEMIKGDQLLTIKGSHLTTHGDLIQARDHIHNILLEHQNFLDEPLILPNALSHHHRGPQRHAETCSTCSSTTGPLLALQTCTHNYCTDCLTNLCAYIQERGLPAIRCALCMRHPNATTSTPTSIITTARRIPLHTLESHLPKQTYDSLLSTSFRLYTLKYPSRYRSCPTPDCPAVYHPISDKDDDPDIAAYRPPHRPCPTCLQYICLSCNAAHPRRSCAQHAREQAGSLRLRVKKKLGIGGCPNCGTLVMKDGGCGSVFCVACKERFEWIVGGEGVLLGDGLN